MLQCSLNINNKSLRFLTYQA